MKIGVIQLRSVLEPELNLAKIRQFLAEAVTQGVSAVFLPEVFYSMSNGETPTPFLIEKGNEHYQAIRSLAKDFKLYILGGSAATLVNQKILNRSYNFSPTGEELVHYDKINLFSVNLSQHSSRTIIDESNIYSAGNKPQLLELGVFKIGLSICFDLRFPELYRKYSYLGANVLTVSSAFTVPTGKAHWHTLLRARAIENQCYVIAAGQWGQHNEKMSSFGHSLIIDPWGEIVADAGEGEKIIYEELSLSKIQQVRSRLNVIRDPGEVTYRD